MLFEILFIGGPALILVVIALIIRAGLRDQRWVRRGLRRAPDGTYHWEEDGTPHSSAQPPVRGGIWGADGVWRPGGGPRVASDTARAARRSARRPGRTHR
ncbi:MAG: hypothetical protein AAGF60_12130 [Pseudomonadota bacterium]